MDTIKFLEDHWLRGYLYAEGEVVTFKDKDMAARLVSRGIAEATTLEEVFHEEEEVTDDDAGVIDYDDETEG